MAAARYAWYGRVSTEDEQDPTLSFSRQLNNSERRVAESGGLIVAHFYNVESGTRRYDPASPSPAGQRRRIWRRTQRCSGLSRAPGEIRTHTVDILSVLPPAIGLRGRPPLDDIFSSISARLCVAVRAEQCQILQSIIVALPIDVLQLQTHRSTPPNGRHNLHTPQPSDGRSVASSSAPTTSLEIRLVSSSSSGLHGRPTRIDCPLSQACPRKWDVSRPRSRMRS
jgi:hypothetical protein